MSIVNSFFRSLLEMSLTASYVVVVVFIARLLLRKSPKIFSYALWGVVLFRLLCPLSFSADFSLLGLIRPAATGISFPQYTTQGHSQMPPSTVEYIVGNFNNLLNESSPTIGLPGLNQTEVWLTVGSLVWLIGIVVLLGYAVLSYLRLQKQISLATLVQDNIYETDLIVNPFVCGFIKPKIYLPMGLAGQEREYIICHEKTHIKRRDYLIKPLAFLALTLHWFNPLIWLSFSLMTKDMEMSCDEKVMQDAAGHDVVRYSNSLLALAVHKKMPAPGPLAFGESNIKARIQNILNYRKPVIWVSTIAVVAVIILAIALLANPLNGYSIYKHPERLLNPDYLRTPVKVGIVDNKSGEEIILTEPEEIAQVTAIVEDMRIAKKEFSKARGGKIDSRYSISYGNGLEDSISEFRFTIHVAPVWIDNYVKPSFSYKLLNQNEILERLAEVFANKSGRNLYNTDRLLQNKTPFVGNNSKVAALVNTLPLPQNVTRDIIQLQTSQTPYGLTVYYNLEDDSMTVSEEQFLRNSIMLFALIDNVDQIEHFGHWQDKRLSSTPFRYTYTRAEAEKIISGDVRQFAKNEESLLELINIVQLLKP